MLDDLEWSTRREKLQVVAWWWAQQGGICCICKDPDNPMEPYGRDRGQNPISASIEHLIAKRDGGRNTVGNVRLAHGACNHAQGTLWEWNRARAKTGEPPLPAEWAIEHAACRMREYRLERERRRESGIFAEPVPRMPDPTIVPVFQPAVPFEIVRPAHRPGRARSPQIKWSMAQISGLPRGATLPGYVPPPADPPPTPPARRVRATDFLERKAKPMAIATTPDRRPVCEACGSADVTMDGTLKWDVARQAWVTAELLETTECNACCEVRPVRWVTVP